jgi:hypothetical protein
VHFFKIVQTTNAREATLVTLPAVDLPGLPKFWALLEIGFYNFLFGAVF